MAIATNAQKETLSSAYGTAAAYLSVHTASPGTTGTSEASGGSYARKALTWTAGSSDGVNSAAAVTFDLPAGTYTHIGVWSASTGGTFLDSYALGSSQVYASAGQLVATATYTQS